ncbi:1-phosphofructokinase family hexose kinase [Candidatus Enterococcus ferrettii]|uniref:Tagatose-6-phosphate kinase n=1 Tax=Candidatus Enterococcus ferrettii TaxID=2815324 RepID=A0ABV0EJH5_9ENTE|nr:1-phosphofructokinase family hexose kinase [Enterococcus sp. 665A]MBO1338474.1 1-phosphofructokinase family hexose kinase [Enterococcus sp. 665A]
MIVTITMNPSMDFAYFIDHFTLGGMNRFQTPTKSVGGKGVNAGRTAAISGSRVLLTGFLGGDFGTLVNKYLEQENLFELDMLQADGETRNAITIMHDGNTHTEIVESGPKISDNEAFQLLEKVIHRNEQEPVDLICISGSVNSDNQQLYLEMLTYIREKIGKHIPVFMDVSGEQLKALLKSTSYKPNFIKPNVHELGEILNKNILTKEEARRELSHPYFEGIDYIMISCGSEGALCKAKDSFYDISIPKINITNTTGSGDASVGGFAHAIEKNYELEEALKYSMACGMSNAQHGEVGVIDVTHVQEFVQDIQVRAI